ncbi:succinate dehydrogenase flavoprotein subunit [Acrodontium crateriforme]|uniref:Succinate dehydrogenase [ubiquinone] cytochrome b small subunit n=1 Tax=Acrodontium crateriforme TaxID=150365 RepID=A0AAQ3MAC8_9PEZI|nr:succinate dehydrogenase flavoprotein subunit [Acrodontium crateriforme]
MAALRTTVLRQVLAAPTQRTLVTSAMPMRFAAQKLAQRPAFSLQRAAFQTSARRSILPPLPQKVRGNVNDAAQIPDVDPTHGSYHWTAERIISVGLIPLTVAPFAAGSLSPLLDGTLCGLIILHTYLGFSSVITDYLPKWRVPLMRKLFDFANFLAVFVVGWGFYEFETNDVGITEAIKRIWTA